MTFLRSKSFMPVVILFTLSLAGPSSRAIDLGIKKACQNFLEKREARTRLKKSAYNLRALQKNSWLIASDPDLAARVNSGAFLDLVDRHQLKGLKLILIAQDVKLYGSSGRLKLHPAGSLILRRDQTGLISE